MEFYFQQLSDYQGATCQGGVYIIDGSQYEFLAILMGVAKNDPDLWLCDRRPEEDRQERRQIPGINESDGRRNQPSP